MVELSGEGSLSARGVRIVAASAAGGVTLGGGAGASAPAQASGGITLSGGGVLIAGATATASISAPAGAVLIATATGTAQIGGLTAEQAVRAVDVANRGLRIVDPEDPAVPLLAESAEAAGLHLEPIPAGGESAEHYEPVSRDELYEMFRLLTQAMLDKPDSGSPQRTEALQWLSFMLQVLLFVAAIRQR